MINQFRLINGILVAQSQNQKLEFDLIACNTFLLYHYAALSMVVNVLFNEKFTFVVASLKLNIIDYFEAIQTYKCNILSGMPKIVQNLIDHPARKSFDLSSLLMVGCGGQLVNADLLLKIKNELNTKVYYSIYGSTELNNSISRIYFLDSFDPKKYKNCIGKPSTLMECKIVDPDSRNIQPLNTDGELHVRR